MALKPFFFTIEKIGEKGDPSEANRILGAPTSKLDDWLQQNMKRLIA